MSQLVIETGYLIKGLSILEGITGGKHINPICGSVLFETKDDRLFLRATNLEDSIETQIPLKHSDFDGRFLVFGQQFLGFVKELSDEEITLILDDNSSTLSIVSSNPEAVISLIPIDEFPALPTAPDNGELVPIPAGVFLEFIEKTAFSTSSEHESRVLYGINLVVEGEVLKATSSDGFRFSRYQSKIDAGANISWSAVIPKRRALDMKRIVSLLFNKDEEVLIGSTNNHFYLGSNNLSIFSRTIDDEYPDYESIIPSDFTREILTEKSSLIQAIRRVCLFSSEKSGGVKIQFDPEGKQIHLSSLRYVDEPFIGMASESLSLEDASGDPVTIGLNYKSVLECLSVLRGGTVRLEFGDSLWPVRFTSDEDEGFYHILMPIQLDEIEGDNKEGE